ncbi:single-stranded DNA-binding protein [Nocardia sp. NPDC050717]|uniref:single-stranded DNA-binding protein n=1 Tax=Nocardia sp. NPDC050717 TaxID=3157221 RepID=UPI00340E33CC
MPGETTLPLIGNLASDIELNFTPAGVAVANFTVASTPRVFDRTTGQWRDGDALFLRCNLWREAAENAAESLTKGARVLVMGKLKQRSYETRDGDKRTVYEIEVDEIGPSLRFARAKVTRALDRSRSGNRSNGFGQPDTTNRAARSDNAPTTAGSSDGQRADWGVEPAGEREQWETSVLAGVGAGFGESSL